MMRGTLAWAAAASLCVALAGNMSRAQIAADTELETVERSLQNAIDQERAARTMLENTQSLLRQTRKRADREMREMIDAVQGVREEISTAEEARRALSEEIAALEARHASLLTASKVQSDANGEKAGAQEVIPADAATELETLRAAQNALLADMEAVTKARDAAM
ncbi:hypothetical protein OCH239_17155, partial [Roseivivax halodurans JCM 10272]